MREDYQTRFKPKPGSLAADILGVRVDKEIDAMVRALPNRSAWLRRVITEAVRRELMESFSTLESTDEQEDHPAG
jgi:hypothetical protein